jgi:hypothetical protein
LTFQSSLYNPLYKSGDPYRVRFGKSDLRTITRRGEHLWYRKVHARLPGNLRRFGLDVDIKTGNQIVIAPSSIHESGHIYLFDNSDWSALGRLRQLNVEGLLALTMPTAPGHRDRQQAPQSRVSLRDGSRKLTINDQLCQCAWTFSSENEMLASAFNLNHKIGLADPRGPLPAEEVVEIERSVWRDRERGRIEKLSGVESRAKRRRSELDLLADIDSEDAPLACASRRLARRAFGPMSPR